jgi:hypothetical protein
MPPCFVDNPKKRAAARVGRAVGSGLFFKFFFFDWRLAKALVDNLTKKAMLKEVQ